MVTIDIQALRAASPDERLDQIRALRKRVSDELKHAEQAAQKATSSLDALERETNRELEALERVRVPESRPVEVERLFRRPKKAETLETAVENAPRTETREHARDYVRHDIVAAVYEFREHHGYDRIANLRDKVATGEQLTRAETESLQRYGELVHEFEKAAPYIRDERAKDLMTRTEKAIHQIEAYKTRKLDDEDRPKQRQEF
jgi:hypothetical protein